MQNYIVIFDIPEKIEEKIKSAYKITFGKEVPISNLHLTLLPPFSLLEKENITLLKEIINKLGSITISASLASPNLFRNPGETILYLPVNPQKEITKIHNKLESMLKDLIKFEMSLYHTDEVPPFLAHISLDYNFTFNSKTLIKLEENFKEINFKVTKPIIVTQNPSGKWKITN